MNWHSTPKSRFPWRRAITGCRSLGYNPTVWVSMLRQVGAAEAARRLLSSGDSQTGFLRLIQLWPSGTDDRVGRRLMPDGSHCSPSNTAKRRVGD